MITIDNDAPITVAQKLITATIKIPDEQSFVKAVNRICGGDGTRDMYSVEELREIAEYLMLYCNLHKDEEKTTVVEEDVREKVPF